ncbi:MAG: hypothetical protein ABIU29_00655 [Chthoniobacterales bacterium]
MAIFRSNGTLSGGVMTGGALTTPNFDASGNRTRLNSYFVRELNYLYDVGNSLIQHGRWLLAPGL